MSEITNTPKEGELVVVTVTTVKQNGCYDRKAKRLLR